MGIAPDRLPGYQPLDDQAAQQRLQALWGKKLPSAPGLDAESLLQFVSGLIVLADDPAAVLPMGQRAMAALGKIEFLVVLDAFLTPTAQMAHVALPIASFAETEASPAWKADQRLRAATDPPGEARAGWQVLAELCTRLSGRLLQFSFGCAQRSGTSLAEIRPCGRMRRYMGRDGDGKRLGRREV